MDGWRFIAWNYQYIIAFVIALILSIYVYNNSKTSKVTKIFFIFGMCVVGQNLTRFIHRSAPDRFLSDLAFRSTLSFTYIIGSLVLIMLLYMYRERLEYWLIMAPSMISSFLIIFLGPLSIVDTDYGWSYELHSWYTSVLYINGLIYTVAAILIGVWILKHVKSDTNRYKVKIILVAILGVYYFGTMLTNALLVVNPTLPPLGGVIAISEFLLISYAVSIEEDNPIKSVEIAEGSTSDLSKAYLRFLNQFYAEMPGDELGEIDFKFDDYLEAMGLKDMIVMNTEKPTFEHGELDPSDVVRGPDRILKVIKKLPWPSSSTAGFEDIFLNTYQALHSESEDKANRWLRGMVKNHGGYLFKHDMLDSLPEEAELSPVFRDLDPGKSYLFEDDDIDKGYGYVKDAEKNGMDTLIFTKLDKENVRERYGLKKGSIQNIVYDRKEEGIFFNDTRGMGRTILDFIKENKTNIVMIDCLDQIILGNGFDETVELVDKIVKENKDTESIIMFSLNSRLIENEEINRLKERVHHPPAAQSKGIDELEFESFAEGIFEAPLEHSFTD